MIKRGLNEQEVEILQVLIKGPRSIQELSSMRSIGKSWCSRCVSHLVQFGLIQFHKNRRRSIAELNKGPVGNALAVLMTEDPLLDLPEVLTGQGLYLLPFLVSPGSTVEHITTRTGLSSRSVRSYIRRWRDLGIVRARKRIYQIHPFHPFLIIFVQRFSEHTLMRTMKAIDHDINILWQDRDECIVTTSLAIDDNRFVPAGPTALTSLGEDIIYSHKYYLYSPVKRRITREEAYIQALLVDRVEPRLKRLLIKSMKARTVNTNLLISFSEQYGIKDVLMEVLSNVPKKRAQEVR